MLFGALRSGRYVAVRVSSHQFGRDLNIIKVHIKLMQFHHSYGRPGEMQVPSGRATRVWLGS